MNQKVHRELMEFHSINSNCYFCFIESNHLILKVQFFSFFSSTAIHLRVN